MSYIYEALKRAEDENTRGAAAPGAARRRPFLAERPRWWFWALLGVLCANAALLASMFLVQGPRSPVETTATTARTETAAGSVGVRRDVDEARVMPTEPSAGRPASPPAAPSARIVAPAAPAARATPPAQPSAAPAVRTAPQVRAPATAAPPVSERATPPEPPVPDRPATSPAPAPPVGLAATPPVSVPAPAPTAPTAADPPKLQVQVVVYDDAPAQRWVLLDGKRYKEGDRIDAETVVERITPDGVVLTRRGQQYTLTSGRP